jgi:hypothetical protein
MGYATETLIAMGGVKSDIAQIKNLIKIYRPEATLKSVIECELQNGNSDSISNSIHHDHLGSAQLVC